MTVHVDIRLKFDEPSFVSLFHCSITAADRITTRNSPAGREADGLVQLLVMQLIVLHQLPTLPPDHAGGLDERGRRRKPIGAVLGSQHRLPKSRMHERLVPTATRHVRTRDKYGMSIAHGGARQLAAVG